MKRIIKLLLLKLGYEIRPLNLNGASDSINYNLPEGADKFYGSTRLAQDYISKNVPVHIKKFNLHTEEKKTGT